MQLKVWKFAGVAILGITLFLVIATAALIERGFRATTAPSRLEVIVARALRDLAIPARERHAKNPLASTAQNLQVGREAFLTRCAGCHGHDGTGLTPIGRSLYPRVPNLRSRQTQSLTDGELHYFIENGVQLTGMPAWRTIFPHSADQSWKLVLFVRSLRHLMPAETQTLASIMARAHYVGSQACERCHGGIYRRWAQTPMANIVRDPRTHPGAIIPKLDTDTVFPFKLDHVAFVYGSLWKQRFFTKIGDDYFPLPVQWEIATHRWSRYVVPSTGADWWAKFYPPDNFQRPTGPTCDGCHSVDYNIHTHRPAEWNVGCERCHGPGSAHVAAPTATNIWNPARADYVAASDTCVQCHSQGRPLTNPIEGKYYDWPVGYRVGLDLSKFWRLEPHTLGETNFYYYADGTAHKNRMQGNDFVQSVMYRRGVTCFDCHDVHGTANFAQLRKPPEALCLDCHGPGSPNGPRTATLEEHTHHKPGSPGSQCVACHMPAIESEGVPNSYVHAHTFRFITPAMTVRYGIPNPCTSCHVDKSTAWATEAMRQWKERSPWRLE
ncbi:MAG: cytochrome c3 family protein [Steroidobacteraceae bacterium]